MIIGVERITIEVPNISQATSEYKFLHGDISFLDKDCCMIGFKNATLELRKSSSISNAKITGMTFLDDCASSKPTPIITSPRQVHMKKVGKRFFTEERASNNGIFAIDHIVLMSNDLDSCLTEFGMDGIGIRLALDKTESAWGGRMLFFRTGKLTVEIIQNINISEEKDCFWGIAYQCLDISATLANLNNMGVRYSPIREGRKNGTLVSTIKSHNLGLPTLLLQNNHSSPH